MSSDYEVGYGKPPKRHQFKPGQSGNPRGRKRKRDESSPEVVARVFSEKIWITVNGKRRQVTTFEAAIRKAVHVCMTSGSITQLAKLIGMFPPDTLDWRKIMAEETRIGAAGVVEHFDRVVDRMLPDRKED